MFFQFWQWLHRVLNTFVFICDLINLGRNPTLGGRVQIWQNYCISFVTSIVGSIYGYVSKKKRVGLEIKSLFLYESATLFYILYFRAAVIISSSSAIINVIVKENARFRVTVNCTFYIFWGFLILTQQSER